MKMADLHFTNTGSLVLCRPQTDVGREWLADNVDPEHQEWCGGAIAIEPRYAQSVIDGAQADGLDVSL
jgi:hypothetical protein